jgi:hypothetical protein
VAVRPVVRLLRRPEGLDLPSARPDACTDYLGRERVEAQRPQALHAGAYNAVLPVTLHAGHDEPRNAARGERDPQRTQKSSNA